MDLPSHKFFQSQPALTTHGDSTIESNMGLYGKNKNNPFGDDFPDPLCKLNLKETSEFVKSFPIPNANAETNNNNNNNNNNTVTQQHRRLEAPSTPGRPVFNFTSNVGLRRNLSRKNFPSKWDDAEKWVMNTTTTTSCQDSPSLMKLSLSESSSKNSRSISKQCDTLKQQMENEEMVSKHVPSFQRSASLDHYNPLGAFNGVVSYGTDHMVLKDKFTNSIEPIMPNYIYSGPTKEGFLFRNSAGEAMQDECTEVIHDVEHKDVGTEMTPLGSSTTSRCHTPMKSSSPARHNTPASRSGLLALANPNANSCTVDVINLECHFSKLKLGKQYDLVTSNWSTSEEEEEEISKSLRHNSSQKADSECRAATWEEEEKNKCCLRYQREEAKIQAWVNLQNAKAESQSRKLEVKIQKMRSKVEEKLMKRMSVVQRKAEEWRSTARQQQMEQIQKATEQAQKMLQNHNTHFSKYTSCGCFPCNNNHH
ncbi:hypothetical protein Lal_00024686 [Lupinus albus]|uniref:Putative remorin n=1 Tax=Lupinus albus TaxID=3870 RepID=A0A6A4PWU9_LUPAL|nr:putative remorin [Lupinus albus]KAF1889362.1 hypothetical protein Lal_00024686 [Lupinus albus]